MANPAPTINQINAFNATQGTIIDFNIIGGTELVRSNRIYIYDLSDNSLICTHLYVSTESIHELPANTDSSIVYESGKSSADFVNGAQYYAQIQTYTDTAGTEGGSGLSVAKMFWCLVDPTLTITAIPSTISTTSYNVSATYDANTSVVSNIIQQYQFSLYSATGSLLQLSGVIVGSGTQQGTSTAYDISYNFTGLSVGSSYYVVVDVTTTQGMGVSTQSSTFTVSIDTPTLGEATVVNNACDGYISVTSNLSSEYGGSASGEIATFETDSVNDVSSLKVTLTPQQDGTPWIGTDHDTTPYLNRAMPTQSNDYNRESGVIVGGTVNWNQHSPITWQSGTWGGVTATNNGDGSYTLNGECTSTSYLWLAQTPNGSFLPFMQPNHKLLAIIGRKSDADIRAQLILYGSPAWSYTISNSDYAIVNVPSSFDTFRSSSWVIQFTTGNTYSNDTIIPQLFDLTQMFGSTIADYIYSLEQATTGAGVAWFKKLFPKPYYAYNAGELMSVNTSAHNTVGFNAWDEELEQGDIATATGLPVTADYGFRTKNFIPVLPNTQYYNKCPSRAEYARLWYYDADKNFISYNGGRANDLNAAITTPQNAYYMKFTLRYASYGTTYNHDICINLSKTTGTPKNGDYVAYDGHSYALDSSLTLRGIPKLDASNNLYYDGDTYASDGTVTRKYGIVDLGTLTWSFIDNYSANFMMATLSTAKANTLNMVCGKGYKPLDSISAVLVEDKSMVVISSTVRIRDDSYSDAASFKTAMSGVYLVYELATATTETAQAYTNPQVVDPDGTEEYVTANYVPVGHDSTYSLECPISGYDEVSANVVGKNLWHTDFTNSGGGLTKRDGEMNVNVSAQTNTTYLLGGSSSYIGYVLEAGTYTLSAYSDDFTGIYVTLSDGTTWANGATKTFATDVTINNVRCWEKVLPVGEYTLYWKLQIELGSTATDYEPYQGQTYTADLGQTVYGGTVDLVSGLLTVDKKLIDLGTLTYSIADSGHYGLSNALSDAKVPQTSTELANIVCSHYMTDTQQHVYAKVTDGTIALATNGTVRIYDTSITASSGTEFATKVSGTQLVYELATPQTIQLTPQEIQTLVGTNNVWSEDGEVEITYNIPITNLLVKRQDVADVSGTWLTLYSQPVTQASDMDFTFIDFLNQYGKTYKYALVPLLTQTQSGVEVEVEGGYTVSDEVQSIFDGVFIADSTGSQKCKANVGYGDVDMNQAVGTITPIGAKYPVVITNSKNQYHNGSISGTIVPDDYYFNGNLSRIDMVNKRNELEQFLTNKRAKIIKDWNGNTWLVMIMENINCTFNNEYGMGIVNFTANWIEVGDPTNQQDLQATGLIDVGGV